VRAALAMHSAFASLLASWRERQSFSDAVGMGVGVATGEVLAANIGSAKRLHYTTTGPAINLAARLADRAPAGTLQLDERTWRLAREAAGLRPQRPRRMRAKGFPTLLPVYRVRC
jgi:adenylate cyclase